MKNKPSRTTKGKSITDLILEVFPLNGHLLAVGDRLAGDAGLTSALWQVLGALDDKPRSVSQISRVMGLTRQSVQRSVNLMKTDGLVMLAPNPDHQTSPLVQMTSKGQTAFRKIMRLQIRWSNQLAEGFTAEELKSATRVLRCFSATLNDNE